MKLILKLFFMLFNKDVKPPIQKPITFPKVQERYIGITKNTTHCIIKDTHQNLYALCLLPKTVISIHRTLPEAYMAYNAMSKPKKPAIYIDFKAKKRLDH